MRVVLLVALVLVSVAAGAMADGDAKPKRPSGKKAPRVVPKGQVTPKHRIYYDVPRGFHKQQQPLAPTPIASAGAVATGPVLRAGVPNSAACAAKNGVCGEKSLCKGTLASGLCSGGATTMCCVAKPGTPTTTPTTPPPSVVPGTTTLSFSKEYLVGKYNPASRSDFMRIPGDSRYIRKDVWAAYQLMNNAARNEIGQTLSIQSATRTFDDQKAIWERKWTTDARYKNLPAGTQRALGIMSYSSMPSTSQHHWGCTFDLVSLEPGFFTGTAQGRKLDAWFRDNAARFGFCRPFSAKPPTGTRVDGYNEEQWHLAYKPVLKPLLQAYRAQVTYADITGFSGSETAQSIGAIEKFVYGISPDCTN